MEVWKDIAGYEGVYQVSNHGRVKSLDRLVKHARFGLVKRKGKILKPFIDTYGYLEVRLCKDGGGVCCSVHRLVLSAFVPNPENKETVNHINENKTDNRVENLEWATQYENMHHNNLIDRIHQKRKRAN